MAKIKMRAGWSCVITLCLLGLFTFFGLQGFQFSAYILFGLAGIVACYLLLSRLRQRNLHLGKLLKLILTVFLCLGILAAAVTGAYVGHAAAGSGQTACDYLIVLGAGVNGTSPSFILSRRLDAAYDYLSANPGTICIVSGGQGPGEDITEAQCMFDVLAGRGIDADRIWMEDRSTSTRENLSFSLALIEEKTGVRPVKAGILSNEFHLFRAGLVARELGLEPIGIPADTKWFSLELNYFLREIPAVWYYVLLGG